METSKVSVVIARFQAPQLTGPHKRLLKLAEKSGKLVVLLGINNEVSDKNPLPYSYRRERVIDFIPSATVLPLYDQVDDKRWTNNVITIVRLLFPKEDITYFGGVDSSALPLLREMNELTEEMGNVWGDQHASKVREAIYLYEADKWDVAFAEGVIYGVHLAKEGKVRNE